MFVWIMNLLYKIHETDSSISFDLKGKISLLGCNEGIIPWAIEEFLIEHISSDEGWHLNISSIFEKWNEKVLIDLKPNHSEEIFLVELTDVFGYNHSSGWTALLYRFKNIHQGNKAESFNLDSFTKPLVQPTEIIYSFLYALGNVKDGKLEGKWSPPYGSMTGLLMWENSYQYFKSIIDKDPEYVS